ncbi:MAG: hypothetical protein WD467_01170 [Candidatus Saccharimonadales bacterium]
MNEIILHYPRLTFTSGNQFVWSPGRRTVFYDETEFDTARGRLALLHEIGHAELDHQDYHSDLNLLNMEMEAWEYAVSKAIEFGVAVDEAHIDRCLETYRVWLYKRSRCPECDFHGIQLDPKHYRCFMCRHTWQVARTLSLQPNRSHCRPCQVPAL